MQPKSTTTESYTSTTPFFTVGITTYKRPERLVKAIQSVLAQTFTDYELIILDDASPDDTEQRVKDLNNPHINYVRQPSNQGVSSARNEIIRRARGEFIVFLDDDDLFSPDFLHFVHEAMVAASPTIGFAVAGRITVEESTNGEIQSRKEISQYAITTELPGSLYLQHPVGGGSGLTVRTSAARATNGFDAEWMPIDDTYFMMELATKWDFSIIPQAILIVYNHQSPQLTSRLSAIAPTQERLGDSEYLRPFPHTRVTAYRYSGRMFYAIQQRKDGRRCMMKAIKVAPFSCKNWAFLLLLEINPFLPDKYRRRLLSNHRQKLPSK